MQDQSTENANDLQICQVNQTSQKWDSNKIKINISGTLKFMVYFSNLYSIVD